MTFIEELNRRMAISPCQMIRYHTCHTDMSEEMRIYEDFDAQIFWLELQKEKLKGKEGMRQGKMLQ